MMQDVTFDSVKEFLDLSFEELNRLTGAEPFFRPRPFNSHLTTDAEGFGACLDELVSQIEKSEDGRKRTRTKAEAIRFRATIRALVLDLYSAWEADPDLQVGINLNANLYGRGKRTRYSNSDFTYRQFKAAFYGLERLGFLRIVKRGWHDETGDGANTKVTGTKHLIELLTGTGAIGVTQLHRSHRSEVIILRSSKAAGVSKLQEYEDTETTYVMRLNIWMINDELLEHDLALRVSDRELDAIQDTLRRHPDRQLLEFSRRTLYRVFNDGVFTRGGRFYGGWWQEVPRDYRSRIMIDGEPTIEADFSSLHPRILYAREGGQCLGDPYAIDGVDPRHRAWVKRALNSLINAVDGPIAPPPGYDALDVGMPYKALLEAVAAAHEPIKHHFRTGVGLELQFLDSQIAERVMLDLGIDDIACLPVHDSFLVQQRHERQLVNTMRSAFKEVIGTELFGDAPERLIKIKQPDLTDLDSLVSEETAKMYITHVKPSNSSMN